MILDNLETSGYTGDIYLVNPKADKIASYQVYNDIKQLPQKLDLAVILTPPRFVPGTLRQLAEVGCSFLSIITAGFSDALTDEILEILRSSGMRLVGPNSMGTYAHTAHASFSPIPIEPGHLGYVSQSGSIIAVAQEQMVGNFGFSSFVSLGNKIDLTELDILPYMANDSSTSVIAGYLESFSKPQQLRKVLMETSQKKPLILVKGGRTAEGSQAVSSHTGALAGNYRLTRALLESCGVLLVDTIEQQIALARFIDKFGIQTHHGIVTISSAGGPGVLASDEIIEAGLNLADLQSETINKLEQVIPPFGNPHNPLDLVADAGIDRYLDTIRIVSQDPGVSTMLVIIVHPVLIGTEPLLAALDQLNIPIICAYLGPEFSSFDHYNNLIIYRTTREVIDILTKVNTYATWINQSDKYLDRSHLHDPITSDDSALVSLLQSYGFTYPPALSTADYSKAQQWFDQLSGSVVLKLDHPKFSHKTDSGGVILDIDTLEQLEESWNQLQDIYSTSDIPQQDRKIELQPYFNAGIELVLGCVKDHQFGHFLLIGAGGTMVELVDDTVFLPSPTSKYQVLEALQKLQIYPLLTGYRGSHPVDLQALADQILQLDQLLQDHPDIRELDINPLYLLPRTGEMYVLDARFS